MYGTSRGKRAGQMVVVSVRVKGKETCTAVIDAPRTLSKVRFTEGSTFRGRISLATMRMTT
jgi:hypothetical protein